jgi:putative endonuclease
VSSFYVYILYCMTTRKSYVGHTSHLILRFYEHRDGVSRWTRQMKNPVCLHWEPFESRAEAMRREKQLKSGQGYYERQRIIADRMVLFRPAINFVDNSG